MLTQGICGFVRIGMYVQDCACRIVRMGIYV